MIEVNLLPDSKQDFLRAQRARTYVARSATIVSIVAIALVVILGIILAGQAVTSNVVSDSITKKTAQLKGQEDVSKILTIQHQLSLLSSMHANKQVTSRLFPLLEAINPPAPNDITMTGVRLDTEQQTISIDGRAASGLYGAAEAFKKTIVGTSLRFVDKDNKQATVPLVEQASDVVSSGVGVSEDSFGKKVLRLTMTFHYPDVLFAESSTNLSVESPSKSNATDSYLRVPQSLFGQGSAR